MNVHRKCNDHLTNICVCRPIQNTLLICNFRRIKTNKLINDVIYLNFISSVYVYILCFYRKLTHNTTGYALINVTDLCIYSLHIDGM